MNIAKVEDHAGSIPFNERYCYQKDIEEFVGFPFRDHGRKIFTRVKIGRKFVYPYYQTKKILIEIGKEKEIEKLKKCFFFRGITINHKKPGKEYQTVFCMQRKFELMLNDSEENISIDFKKKFDFEKIEYRGYSISYYYGEHGNLNHRIYGYNGKISGKYTGARGKEIMASRVVKSFGKLNQDNLYDAENYICTTIDKIIEGRIEPHDNKRREGFERTRMDISDVEIPRIFEEPKIIEKPNIVELPKILDAPKVKKIPLFFHYLFSFFIFVSVQIISKNIYKISMIFEKFKAFFEKVISII